MSFLENPFSVLHYADGDDNDAGETEKNPVVKGKNDNQQKQQAFSDQSRVASVPYRHSRRHTNGEMGRGSENVKGFYRFDNGALQTYNGQSNGGKDNNGQHEINDQYGYKQGNGYDSLNDQPPPDGDYSSEGGWNFVGERKGGTLRRRIGSWRINSSKPGGLNEVKGEKFFPKPKQSVKNSYDKNVKIEGEETTEQITRRNQSSELIKKVQRNMTLKEYEELLVQKRKASEAISPAEEESTLEKPERCLDKSISMDFYVKLFKRRDDHTVDKNPVGYRRDIQSGGQSEQFDIEGCSEIVSKAPFDINIQDHEQFPCLNVVIKT